MTNNFKKTFTAQVNFAKEREEFKPSGLSYVQIGNDNLLYEDLLRIYQGKALTHKTITDLKLDFIMGGGIQYDTNNQSNIDFFENKFGSDTLEHIIRFIVFDYIIYGGFSLKVKWNKTFNKIAGIDYVPFYTLRQSNINFQPDRWIDDEYEVDNDGNKLIYAKEYIYKPFWGSSNVSMLNPQFITYQGFSLVDERSLDQILYCTPQPISPVYEYPMPDYIGALPAIRAEYGIFEFLNNSIEKGFSADKMISVVGRTDGTPDEQGRTPLDKFLHLIKKTFTGSKGEKLVLETIQSKDEQTLIQNIPTGQNNKDMADLVDEIVSAVVRGSKAPSQELLNIQTAGALGNKQAVAEFLAVYQSTYLTNIQSYIECQINKLLAINGGSDMKFIPFSFEYNDVMNDTQEPIETDINTPTNDNN